MKPIIICWACDMPACRYEKHHVRPKRAGGMDLDNLCILCVNCHDLIDRIKLESILDWLNQEQVKKIPPVWITMLIVYYFSLIKELIEKFPLNSDEWWEIEQNFSSEQGWLLFYSENVKKPAPTWAKLCLLKIYSIAGETWINYKNDISKNKYF